MWRRLLIRFKLWQASRILRKLEQYAMLQQVQRLLNAITPLGEQEVESLEPTMRKVRFEE